MLNEKTGIGPGLLFILIFSAVFGYGLIISMYFATEYFGVSGYWAVALAFLLMIPVMLAINGLGRRFPGKSIIAYLRELTGAIPGKLLGLVYLLFMISLTIWSIRTISGIFHIYILLVTPLQVTIGLILATVFYITGKGIEGITRVAAFLFILCLIFILLYTATSFQNFQLENTLPTFDFTIRDLLNGKYLHGFVAMFNIGLPLGMLFMVYPYLTEWRKGLKVFFGASGLAVLLIGIAVYSCIGTYGAKGVLQYSWPFMEQGKETNIPYIGQTLGLFMPVVMLIQILFASSAFYFAAVQSCVELFGGLGYKTYRWVLLPIIFMGGILLKDAVFWRKVTPYFQFFGFGVVFVLPLLLWFFAVISGKGASGKGE